MDSLTQYFYLNLDLVPLARHFQYRKKVFFQVIVINGPLEKVKYHVIRVEFKSRGSPYGHSFKCRKNYGEYIYFFQQYY